MWTTTYIEIRTIYNRNSNASFILEVLIFYFKYHYKWMKFARLMNDILDDVSSLNLGVFVQLTPFGTKTLSKLEDGLTSRGLPGIFKNFMIVLIGHFDEFIYIQTKIGVHWNTMYVYINQYFALLSWWMTINQIFFLSWKITYYKIVSIH